MRLSDERRLLLLLLATGLPGTAAALVLLAFVPPAELPRTATIAIGLGLVAAWIALAVALRRRLLYTLRTLAALLEGLRREDFSVRARRRPSPGALDAVLAEINELAAVLQDQRLGALEASALLRNVMRGIGVAVFAFDADDRLRLANRAGERLLRRPQRALVGRPAAELGLDGLLAGAPTRTVERTFPGGDGPWALRRSSFRQRGLPHRLVVLADLSQALREEERRAWQRLIRVLGHELNNSLAPIKSMAETLRRLLARTPPRDAAAGSRDADLERGLALIEDRASALSRFMASYARLARLPPPSPVRFELGALVARVAALERGAPVTVVEAEPLELVADPAQVEQVLVNLVKNAAEAAAETAGGVRVGWGVRERWATAWVEDEGPGLAASGNVFVPFFTTKPGGTGIGLVLSRQIAEAHGGTLTVENRDDGPGCVARLRLPLDNTAGEPPA